MSDRSRRYLSCRAGSCRALEVEASAGGVPPQRPRLPQEVEGGDWGPLRQLLTAGWESAQAPARRLLALLRALDGQGDRPWLTLMRDGARVTPEPSTVADPGDADRWRRALTACLLGGGRTTLAAALAGRLERVGSVPVVGGWVSLRSTHPTGAAAGAGRSPGSRSQPGGDDRARALAAALGEGLALCLSLHPGPQDRAAHAERIQGLAARLTSLTIAAAPVPAVPLAHWDGAQCRPDPAALARLWDALEAARLALTGQTVRPQDRAFVAGTFEQIKGLIPASFDLGEVPPGPWPPLAHWLERTESALVHQPGPEACRAALGADEGLAQFFFDVADGRLWLLWLHGARAPLCLALPAECGRARWHNDAGDGVLNRWERALAAMDEGDPKPFDTDAWPAFHDGAPARTLSGRLAALADAERVGRVVLLLPADLGQLPWETLPAFAPDRLTLERAPSLDSWWRRAGGTGPLGPGLSDAAPRASAPPPRALAGDDDTLWFHKEELAAAGDCFGDKGPRPRASLAAVLRALRAPGGKHLLMHAKYQPDNPWSSYFLVRRRRDWDLAAPHILRAAADPAGADAAESGRLADALLAAWVVPVLGVTPDPIGLSACWAARYGAGLSRLSTSVGLGASLLAGGARCVVGALWPCHQAAAALFYRTLYTRAAAAPGVSWYRLVHEARETLRTVSTEDLARVLAVGQKDFSVYNKVAEIDPRQPSFWAGFVVLGDGASPSHGSGRSDSNLDR